MKENKKILIICGVIGAFLLLILIVSVGSGELSELESKIYNATKSELSSFKDPSSVKIQEVQICGDYAKVSIGANNSFGASVSSEYVMYVGEKLTPEGKVVDDYYWLRDGNLKSSNDNSNEVKTASIGEKITIDDIEYTIDEKIIQKELKVAGGYMKVSKKKRKDGRRRIEKLIELRKNNQNSK